MPVAVAPRGYVADPGGLHRVGVGFVDTPEGRAALTVASGLARAAGGTVAVVSVLEPIEASPASVMPGWSVRLAQRPRSSCGRSRLTTARRLLPEDLPS